MSQPSILLVENDPNDRFLFELYWKRAAPDSKCCIIADADEAIDFLNGVGRYSDRNSYPMPSLIVIDLHFEGGSTHSLIKRMRSDPRLKSIPIVVMSGSSYAKDVDEAYDKGASSFISKPRVGEDYAKIAQVLKTYWLDFNQTSNNAKRLV